MAQVNGVLVCGGAGFIGSHLVDRLLADGHSVEVVDDLSVGSLANLSAARAAGGTLRFHHLDISAPEFSDLIALRRPTVIYHLALLPTGATRTNEMLRSATLLLSVLEAARRFAVKKLSWRCLPVCSTAKCQRDNCLSKRVASQTRWAWLM